MRSYAVQRVHAHYPDLSAEEIASRLHYATFVNIPRRYMYYAIPKAGCTTIKTMIHKLENLPPIPALSGSYQEVRRDMFVHNREMFQMKTLLACTNEEQEQVLTDPDFFRFTVVRNPYTRLQSSWKDKVRPCAPGYAYLYHKIKNGLPNAADPSSLIGFEEFVTEVERENLEMCNRHWRRQTHHALIDALDFSHIGRIENLHQALQLFADRAGYSEFHEPASMNHSGQGNSPYDEALAERVYQVYRDDFERFGYDKDSWRPAEGHAAGKSGLSKSELGHIDEIVERNIIIGELYREREKLRTVKKPDALKQFKGKGFEHNFKKHIAPIAGWIDKAGAQILFEAARQLSDGCIVEIGGGRGRSTAALALGSAVGASVPVFTVEPHEPAGSVTEGAAPAGAVDRGFFMQCMLDLGLFHIVRMVNLDSGFVGNQWPLPVKLLFIGPHKTNDAVKAEINLWRNKLAPDAVTMVRMKQGPDQTALINDLQNDGFGSNAVCVNDMVILKK